MSNALQAIEQDLLAIRPTFEAVTVDQAIVFDRELGFAMQVLGNNEYLQKVAMSNRQSLVDAVVNVSGLGVSLNPAKKHAYLVPRDGRVCLDISYMGMIALATQTGSIRWAQARLVYKGDGFKLHGFDRPPTHEHDPFSDERSDIVGVYVVVKTADGDYLTHTMRIAEVHAIRDRSSAWKAWIEKKKRCPWVTDEAEMIKKTCIKQASKTWPRTDRLDAVVHYANTVNDEGLADDELSNSDEVAGRKPEVSMPQPRGARAAAPDVTDADPRPARQPSAQPAKPAGSDATLATEGELNWARRKVDALQPTRKAELEGQGYNISGNLAGLTKGQFAALRKELA